MKMPESFKTELIEQMLPASLKKPINDGLRIQTFLLDPANDNMKHTSAQSKGADSIFAQARAIKNAVERLRYQLILDFFSSLRPR